MLKAIITNQLETESALWEELSDVHGQSMSGGLSTVVPITFSSLTALPPSQGNPIRTAPQSTPFKIPFSS